MKKSAINRRDKAWEEELRRREAQTQNFLEEAQKLVDKISQQREEQRPPLITTTEFSEEVTQEHLEFRESILLPLESGRCITTTTSNTSFATTEADDMKGISDALQHIDEK